MKHIQTARFREDFQQLAKTRLAQAMMMTLPPAARSSDKIGSEHPASEQWLFVISGSGIAVGEKGEKRRRVKLTAGSLLIIETHEKHQVSNTGTTPLVTLNIYVPPAYSSDGDPL